MSFLQTQEAPGGPWVLSFFRGLLVKSSGPVFLLDKGAVWGEGCRVLGFMSELEFRVAGFVLAHGAWNPKRCSQLQDVDSVMGSGVLVRCNMNNQTLPQIKLVFKQSTTI